MSEHENNSGTERVSPVVMAESNTNKKSLTRPNEMRNESTDLHQKSAPAIVASLAQKLKDPMENTATMEVQESANAVSTEIQKQSVKKFSSNTSSKRRDSSPVAVPVTPVELESKHFEMISLAVSSHPAPAQLVPSITDVDREKDNLGKKSDEADSITSEIAEMQTPEVVKKSSEWSGSEEEAGGLERSDSRASRSSRVVRAMRQLLCCGVRLQPPSEDNMSSPRSGVFNSGI